MFLTSFVSCNPSTLGFEWINHYEGMTEAQEEADRKARLKAIIDKQNKEFDDLSADLQKEMDKMKDNK